MALTDYIIMPGDHYQAACDKIRERTGKTDMIRSADMAAEIDNIPKGVELPALTNPGTASDLVEGTELIDGAGKVVTGNIPKRGYNDVAISGSQVHVPAGYYEDNVGRALTAVEQATPSISVDTAGKITASATQSEGYVNGGTKSATKQLTVQAAQTITPGTSDKTIAAGKYLTGTQTIKGDSNLVPENIKKDVSIFGVTGTMEAGGSFETCTLTLVEDGPSESIFLTLRYVNASGELVDYQTTHYAGETLVIPKNVILYSSAKLNGDATKVDPSAGASGTYHVYGDVTVKCTM